MVEPKEFLKAGQYFHGHKCPAMPMGLRVGAAAMNKLGVGRSKDSQLLALVELGDNHFATCFADGIQIITGCTFGKGNIKKLHYGKWGVTLIDTTTGRAVRVTPKSKALLTNMKTRFFTEYRMKHIQASRVPSELVDPLVDKVMDAPVDMLMNIGEVFDYEVTPKVDSFTGFVCNMCGEFVVDGYGELLNGKKVCQPCYEKAKKEH